MGNSSSESVWQDLVVSILSVNQYTLTNTYKSIDALAAVGIFDPNNLIAWSVSEIELKLKQGGCDRGEFMTHLFAERISALGNFVKDHGVSHCEKLLNSDSHEEINDLLSPVKGIGPKVLQNYFLLRRID